MKDYPHPITVVPALGVSIGFVIFNIALHNTMGVIAMSILSVFWVGMMLFLWYKHKNK